jgi:sigma-54 specific flagellar transcriptional regulator A
MCAIQNMIRQVAPTNSNVLIRGESGTGSTMFLDEIGDMPVQMQVKLLRVLQERCIEPLGSNRSINCDVRIIAATHHNLEASIHDGRFREDLFYRLNVFPVDIPPLRERISDLPLLVANLQSSRGRRAPLRLSGPAVECLMQYPWPGNVRELANLLERLSILYPRQVVQPQDLPECYRASGPRGLPAGGLQDERARSIAGREICYRGFRKKMLRCTPATA